MRIHAPEAARATAGTSPLQATLIFIVLAGLLPLTIATVPSAFGESAFFLATTVTVWSAGKLSYLVYRGEPRVLMLGVYLFIYPFMGLASLAQASAGTFPLPFTAYTTGQVESTLIVVLTGIVAFELGALVTRREPRAKPDKVPLVFSQPAVVVLGLAGLVLVAYSVLSHGLMPYFTSRESASAAIAGLDGPGGAYALQDKTGYLLITNLTRIPVFVALLATLAKLHGRTWDHGVLGRPATLLFTCLLIGANVVVNNPISNSRFWAGTVMLAIVAVYIPWRKPQGFRWLTYLGLSVFVFAFALLDFFRRTIRGRLDLAGPRESMLTDGSYSAFQTTLNGTVYLESHASTLGEQLVTAMFTFVPRSIWREKSVDTGELVDSTYNRAATLWTEMQVDFGMLGVVVGFAALGAIVMYLDRRVPTAGEAMTAIAVLGPGLLVLTLRGSLVTAMSVVYPLALFLFLAIALFRPSARHPSRSRRRVGASI